MRTDAMRTAVLVMLGAWLVLASGAACLADSVDRATGLSRTRAALSPRGSAKIVCFGDSITGIYYHTGGRRAWPEMLEIALRKACPQTDVTVINAGITSQTTVDALARIDKDVLRHKPQLVAVMFGMNDVVRVPLDTFANNLTEIVRQCRQIQAEVLLCTPNSVYDTKTRPVKKLVQYAEAVRRVGRENNVPVVDCYAAYETVRARDPKEWALLMSEMIHPNMAGHKLFAEEIARAITGKVISLAGEGPPIPAIPRTLSLLAARKPIKILAMPPYDKLIAPALRQAEPSARIHVTTWHTAGLDLAAIERDARKVRQIRPDLVVLAVPATAGAKSTQQFITLYADVLNGCLSFGLQEWDCIAVTPSVAQPDLNDVQRKGERLTRRLIRAQDISMVDRSDNAPTETMLARWCVEQMAPAKRTAKGK